MDFDRATTPDERVKTIIDGQRLSPGFVDIPKREYLLRPEDIEAVFYMYRLTGDPKWMDKAWGMFEQIEKHTRTHIAAASLVDTILLQPSKQDKMESFWLGETLKYAYLVFAE